MNNIEYKRYKELKSQFDIEYKGIKLNRVLALSIWNWANCSSLKSILKLTKNFILKYDFSFLVSCEKDRILYSDITRSDHATTFCDIAERVKDKYAIFNIKGGLKKCTAFSIKNMIYSVYVVFKSVKGSYLKKFGYAGYVCMYMNTIDSLYKLKISSARSFVAYSVVHETENLLAQFYRSKGARIIGLTHGAQFIYKKGIPIDCVNYENLHADCLVWGQMTKDEYIGYGISEDSLFVAGYPKNVTVKELPLDVTLKRCLVLLCRKQYNESNLSLLQMLSSFNTQYQFYIKLHPSCDSIYYSQVCNKYGYNLISKDVLLVDCMDNRKYDFAIAVNTSSYYEILTAGIPCFRYDDGAYDLQSGDEHDKISDKESFSNAVAWLEKVLEDKTYDIIRRDLLDYNLGIGIDKYREYLI
ncbi:MAG: hypothetical protein K5860_00265 [Bacteroidales bacterium]|nr:hypothetical protein [Bacteroidales bacterium]